MGITHVFYRWLYRAVAHTHLADTAACARNLGAFRLLSNQDGSQKLAACPPSAGPVSPVEASAEAWNLAGALRWCYTSVGLFGRG